MSNSKIYKIVDVGGSEPLKSVDQEIDWEKCALCQTDTGDALQCPAQSKRSDIKPGLGYKSVADNIKRFHELGDMPIPLNMNLLDAINELGEIFLERKARWHKVCKDKFSNLKRQRAEKRNFGDSADEKCTVTTSKVTRHSFISGATNMTADSACFFCGETSGDLHLASTFVIDKRVRECALELQDTLLLAKLSAGDMISQDAKYHSQCLVSLYNRASRSNHGGTQDDKDKLIHGIALAELVSYIEEVQTDSDMVSVFKLADLSKMYEARLDQLGVETKGRIHTTTLKNRLLSNFPDMEAHKQGRDILLVSNKDIGLALKKACENDFDDEALIMAKAAKIVRRDMLNIKSSFNGTFQDNCQQDAVPQSLTSLVGMILGGPNIQTQSSNIVEAQATLTISQLLLFNSTVRRRDGSNACYHTKEREPPLPIYIGCLLHAQTRKRGLVDKLNDLGLSISYGRVLELSTAMGNGVCDRFEIENVVCPQKLRHGLFTTSAVDNIDHNPSSTTAQGALHGTGLSLFQHPSESFSGHDRGVVIINPNATDLTTLRPLPIEYTNVPPINIWKKNPEVPEIVTDMTQTITGQITQESFVKEYEWLDHVKEVLEAGTSDSCISWAAFHASQLQQDPSLPVNISSLLPLFQEQAKSVAMIRHSMNVVQQAVQYLNAGQVPVIACDQPLYAIAKQIQWNWPNTYGENHFVIMFGGLHIEMAALKTLGDLLEDSGWTSALVQANVASSGTADSFLKASHITRTRHAHQVTACCLYILMKDAYADYERKLSEDQEKLAFDAWCQRQQNACPHFQYWSMVLDFQLTIFVFVKSLRLGDFSLYVESLHKLIPWFFALDHTNYARWLPVHLRDMVALSDRHPHVYDEFKNGNFVIHKTNRAFSAIPIDQAHEQNNKSVKGDGGAVGLTENTSQLLRWMVCGPEVARVIDEFEASQEIIKHRQSKGPDLHHHEQVKSVQATFSTQVRALVDVVNEMGNPFMENSKDLLVLDTRDIVDDTIVATVQSIQKLGQEQCANFISECLDKRTKSVFDPIKRNKLPLFSCPPPRAVPKDRQQISSLKKNCSLFSQLYVSCQVRDGNLDEFFRHENQSCPPSLSQLGKLRGGTKSELVRCLEKVSPVVTDKTPVADIALLDGAAIVNLLKPGAAKTFSDYSEQVFTPYIRAQLNQVQRLDIIWDEYIQDSLKAMARTRRGKGVRRRVNPNTRLPGNWQSFLRVDKNKAELFSYLGQEAIKIECGEKQILSTQGTSVISRNTEHLGNLMPCNHEEADTRLMLHAADAARHGYKKLLIRTVDTDVVVLAIALVQRVELDELWVAFGTGKTFRYIAAHNIARTLGTDRSKGLPGFHAFTGCDQTSFFAGRGKKTAWDTWSVFDDVTPAFISLSSVMTDDSLANVMPVLQRFVILMYDRACNANEIDEARKLLFTQKSRQIDAIPPTQSALQEHTKRVVYQSGYCWGQCLIAAPQMPSPNDWGWMKSPEKTWEPLWSVLPQASKSCQELLRCRCKAVKGCRGNCKCVKAEMKCTALCMCAGDCDREDSAQ